MTKLTGLALMAALAFAVTPVFAGDKEHKEHSCCATDGACAKSYAKLNLTPDQKTKMDTALEKCKAAGCTKESMAEFTKTAETVLSKEQMAGFNASCAKPEKKS